MTTDSFQPGSSSLPPRAGDRITVTYADHEFEVIVIDPNGLGKGQPSFGLGFNMAQKYVGIPQQTLTDRVTGKGIDKYLENPSGKAFRVTGILGTDGNNYTVVEAGDWFDLATDILVNPGKTRKATKEKGIKFLAMVCDHWLLCLSEYRAQRYFHL